MSLKLKSASLRSDPADAGAVAPTPSPGSGSLQRPALYLEVAERLRQRIFDQTLQPGEWIDELKLAQAWGISRTPLREALKVLAAEGLVTMKVRRGAYVTETSAEDVIQVYALLSLLESDAAANVARRASDAELAELAVLHAQLEAQARHAESYFRLNEAFHMRLLDIEGNRWRRQLIADLRKVMKLSRHHSLFRRGRLQASLAEHRALMQALQARDPGLARQRMQEHFDHGLKAATSKS